MKNWNLFMNTRKLTSSKEDHLTEFLAALIVMNEPFRIEFSRLLLAEYAKKNGWVDPLIDSVETQVSYSGTNCCPDMRFTLQDGHVILCENKIEATDTQGSASDPRGQLHRYLDLPCDGLAYIRATPKLNIEQDVLEHERFITHNGHHFLWRDVYPLLQDNKNPLVASVCRGFEVMGFVPPLPAVGTLSDFNSNTDKANRAGFKELWQPTVAYGQSRGWKTESNKNAEVYFTPDAKSPLHQIFISPSMLERFLIRMTLREGVKAAGILNKLESVGMVVPFEVVNYERRSNRNKITVVEEVIDITSSLSNVIGKTDDRTLISQRLKEYVECFVGMV